MTNLYDLVWLDAAKEEGVDIKTCSKDELIRVAGTVMIRLLFAIRRLHERSETAKTTTNEVNISENIEN